VRQRKAFFKAFFITFAVMAVFAVLLLSEVPDLSKPKQNTSSTPPQTFEYVPSANDKFTVLLSLTLKPDAAPYAYFLLNFDGMQRKLNILRLPEQTLLSKEGESKIILSEQFKSGASALAVRAISRYFDCDVSRYIAIDNSNLHALFSLFDPTEIELSQSISQIEPDRDIYIKLDKGRQLVSASGMLDLIAATAWQGGQAQTLFESANAIAAFLNQNGNEIFKSSSCKLEDFVLNHTVNNFSVMDFEKRRELICYILSSQNGARAVTLHGENANADTEFRIDSSSFAQTVKMLDKNY